MYLKISEFYCVNYTGIKEILKLNKHLLHISLCVCACIFKLKETDQEQGGKWEPWSEEVMVGRRRMMLVSWPRLRDRVRQLKGTKR